MTNTTHLTCQVRQNGFSTIELMVSIAIFVMLTTMLLFGYGSLNGRVNVDTLAHSIGQWVRGAQISSMGVRRSDVTGTFPPGYGLNFSTQSGQNNRVIYFRDTNNNKRYDVGEAEKTLTLEQGYTVSSICGAPGGSTCGGVANLSPSNFVDITFSRPEPDAIITGQTGTYSPVYVTITSPKGYRRAIVVYATGQVSIKPAP